MHLRDHGIRERIGPRQTDLEAIHQLGVTLPDRIPIARPGDRRGVHTTMVTTACTQVKHHPVLPGSVSYGSLGAVDRPTDELFESADKAGWNVF
ncbi:hypothetical protein GCM10022238_45860 [Gordonia hankookensis]